MKTKITRRKRNAIDGTFRDFNFFFLHLGLVGWFLGRHASDKLPKRWCPFGGTVERGCGPARWSHLVGIRRRGRWWRYTRVRRELPVTNVASNAATALGLSTDAQVFIVASWWECVIDVRDKPGQRTTGYGSFRGRWWRVRKRTCRQTFCKFGTLQFDVWCGHAIGWTAKLVERETTSDKSRSLVPVVKKKN